MKILRAAALISFFSLALCIAESMALTCFDCCVFPGEPDYRDGYGYSRRAVGGLEQTQRMISCDAAFGFWYSSHRQALEEMLSYIEDSDLSCLPDRNVVPCLSLPRTLDTGHEWMDGTMYGRVYEGHGGYAFSVVVYEIDVGVECVAQEMDTDADGVADCVDNCPLTYNPDQADTYGGPAGDACGDCPDCNLAIEIDGNPVEPGQTATLAVDNSLSPCPRNFEWSVSAFDGTARAGISWSASGDAAVLTEVSGEGWLKITAKDVDSECESEALLYVGCERCEADDSDCGPGSGRFELDDGVKASFGLGKSFQGRSAGSLLFFPDDPSQLAASPSVLKTAAFPGDVEIVRDANGALRQVASPQSFAEISSGADSFEIRFDLDGDKGAKEGGYFTTADGAEPFVVWKVENPDGDKSALKITEYREGAERSVVEYARDGDLAMIRGGGLRIETEHEEKVGDDRIVVKTVEDGQGSVSSKIRRTWRRYEWGEELVEKVVDPDGAALTAAMEYVAVPTDPVRGRIAKVSNPDGSWKRFEYDAAGRKTKEVACLLDETNTDADESEVRAVHYDYSPQHADDSNAAEHAGLPRKIVETVGGVEVSRTWKVRIIDAGYPVEIVERATEQSCAAFGDPKNPRTVKIFHPVERGRPGSGRPKRITHPDGSLEVYEYEWGEFAYRHPGTQFYSGYEFVPGTYPENTDVRTTLVRGTDDHWRGVPEKTVREITVADRTGNALGGRVDLCMLGGGDMDYLFVSSERGKYDERGRLAEYYGRDGSERRVEREESGCCEIREETDEAGTTFSIATDAQGRVASRTLQRKHGPFLTTYCGYDASGRKTSERRVSDGLELATSYEYDLAGRLVKTTRPGGLSSFRQYSPEGRKTTTIRPDGGAEIIERYADGRAKSMTGDGVADRYFSYGANADGTRWARVDWGARGSEMREKAVFDMAGRLRTIRRPAFGEDGAVYEIEYVYDEDTGRLAEIRRPDTAPFLIEYDEAGRVERTGLDLDFNVNPGLTDDTEDRISEYETKYEQDGYRFLKRETKVFQSPGSNCESVPLVESIRKEALGSDLGTAYALGANLIFERRLEDAFGNETAETVAATPSKGRVEHRIEYHVDDDPDTVDIAETLLYEDGLPAKFVGKTGEFVEYDRDGLGRIVGVVDSRTGTARIHYDDANRIDWIQDPAGNRESYACDCSTGRLVSKTDALGRSTRYGYDDEGRLFRIWGDAAEPVEYVYEDLNRVVEIRTFRQGGDWNSEAWPDDTGPADIVRFRYDSRTGLLTSREYSDGSTVSWTYTAAGRIASRTLARTDEEGAPLTTEYVRDPGTAEIVETVYSDDTPDLKIARDRLGRPATAEWTTDDGLVRVGYQYDCGDLKLESETFLGLYPSVRRIERSYEPAADPDESRFAGRYKGFDPTGGFGSEYGFDEFGRLETLRFDLELDSGKTLSDTFDYEYLAYSDLVEKISAEKGLSRRIAWHATADLPKTIENRLGRRTISRYDLERDALWRITDIQKSGEAEASAMAQKASLALRRGEDWIRDPLYLDDGAIDVAPERRQYSYDNAGNRLQSVEWLDTLETLTSTYTTNMLNQYTTINEDDGDKTLQIDLSHDPDGNLSRFEGETDIRYEYDAENRLKRVRPNIPSEGDIKVEFLYDWLDRRVKKSVFKRGPASWKTRPEYEKLYVYDGHNVIEEITNTYENGEIVVTASRYFVRGLDLSGTMDGAGGIGGLLATVDPETSSVYYHLYGPNGNTAQLLSDNGKSPHTTNTTSSATSSSSTAPSPTKIRSGSPPNISTKKPAWRTLACDTTTCTWQGGRAEIPSVKQAD